MEREALIQAIPEDAVKMHTLLTSRVDRERVADAILAAQQEEREAVAELVKGLRTWLATLHYGELRHVTAWELCEGKRCREARNFVVRMEALKSRSGGTGKEA